jgi:hypothetical protein
MDTMLNLKLDADLVETLKRTTAQEGVTVEQVFDELARRYIAEARRKIIDQEFAHYVQMHAELKEKYLGQNVAIHQGKLVDADPDAMTLVRRVRAQYGRIPILFVQVENEPEKVLTIHSTRIVSEHGNPA